MPVITDVELQHYQEQAEENEKLYSKNEHLKESYDSVLKQRNIFLGIGILLLLLLLSGIILRSLKPEILVNPSKLEARGLTLVETKEYAMLKEFQENQLTNVAAAQNTATESDYGEDEYANQESIAAETVYAVQIGAFVNNDIQLYSDSFTQFSEFKQDGFYKYSLGAFETLEEAQEFRKDVVNLGFSDAFVASFVNGERIAIENPY